MTVGLNLVIGRCRYLGKICLASKNSQQGQKKETGQAG